ncbi:MAG TPA: efflux RND transporter permease subunit [Candidatus Baltobacteraceae bacterium]|jgi:HAE1 family hydrophobic/amphiphilic exporter-1|nr:efflux RND transporter permease subunit [Candidatus Baltobacteraceae bacterium]
MSITRVFVNRPTLAVVALLLILLGGGIAAKTIVQQNFPNVDNPTITVRLSYPGGSPTQIRDAIVRPLEDTIAGAPELDHLNTTIQQGQATISAFFTLSSNKTTDLVEIQRRVEVARAVLPTDLVSPTIRSYDPSEPDVVSLRVTSNRLSTGELSGLVTNEIIPAIEQVPGVSTADAPSTATPAIEVQVDPSRLSSEGLTFADLTSAISGNNTREPGGIATGPARETQIDVRGDLSDPSSVANLPVNATKGVTGNVSLAGPQGSSSSVGASATPAPSDATVDAASQNGLNPWSVSKRFLRVADVASVSDGYERKRVYTYTNGNTGINIDVQKASDASEVDTSDAVIAALPSISAKFPDVTISVVNVQATFTRQQIESVEHTLVQGILVTGIAMLFFLRSWRNAIVVMLSIPASLLVTLVVMKALNFTIDTVSLLAMTLIIGILVDDSIVVLENIERHFERGEGARSAAISGRMEIGTAALVITLVDVVVFLPIAFLPGIVGRYLSEFAIVVVIATLTSLAVSFTITPALAGSWSLLSQWKPPGIVNAFSRGFENLRNFYVEHVLRWSLAHPFVITSVSLILTIASIALVPVGLVGSEFMPRVDRGQIAAQMTFASGTPLATTQVAIARLSGEVYRMPGVQRVVGTAGAYQSGFGGSINLGSVGQLQIFLDATQTATTERFAKQIGSLMSKEYPAAGVVAIPATSGGGGNSQPIDYIITATDDNPAPYAQRVFDAMLATPGTTHVTGSLQNGAPQLDLVFDRERARALDVEIASAASAVRAGFGGSQPAQITTTFGTEYVQVIEPERLQTTTAGITELPVRTQNGSLVHVGDFSSLVSDPNPPTLTRVNRATVVHVSSNLIPGASLSNVQRDFRKRLAALNLPSSVQVAPNRGGNQQNLGDLSSGVVISLSLSLLLVYLLIVALYDSYRLPSIIMCSVPVATVGALSSLWITGQTLNLFSMIGTIMLIGLVSKNGILLVEFAAHHVHEGLDRTTAIRSAARERFRPIIMTTASMILGMLPMALAIDPGSASRRSLGIVVIGGLTSSLLLTLVLVPVIFVWFAPRPPKQSAMVSSQNISAEGA